MWQQLGSVALDEGDISTAERCAAALGDISRARFLHKVGESQQRGDQLRAGFRSLWVFVQPRHSLKLQGGRWRRIGIPMSLGGVDCFAVEGNARWLPYSVHSRPLLSFFRIRPLLMITAPRHLSRYRKACRRRRGRKGETPRTCTIIGRCGTGWPCFERREGNGGGRGGQRGRRGRFGE